MADWSGLGFNPAPGDLEAVERTARETRSFADSLQDDARSLASVGTSVVWVGDAADAFKDNVKHLPKDLRLAADAFGDTAVALQGYAGSLQHAQSESHRLEYQALQVRDELERAEAAAAAAAADDPGRTALQQRVHDLSTQLGRLRRAGEAVEGQLRDAGRRAAEAVRAAAAHAPDEPGILHQAAAKLGGFVRDHAAGIALLSKALKTLGTVLGVAGLLLFWVPGLGQALTAAGLVTQLGSTALDAALWASGAVDPETGMPYATGKDVAIGAATSALFFVGGTAASGLARASGGAARARSVGVVARVNRLKVVRREFRQTLEFMRPSRAGAWGRRVHGDWRTFRGAIGSSGASPSAWFAPHVESGSAAAWTMAAYHIGAASTIKDVADNFGGKAHPAQLRPGRPAHLGPVAPGHR